MKWRAELPISNPVGLHARPAATLVQTAKRFNATIVLEKQGRKADAKSIFQVLALGTKNGDMITLTVEGEQAEEAFHALTALIASGLDS